MRVRRRTPIATLVPLLLVAQVFTLAGADAPAAIAQTAAGDDLAKAAIVFAGNGDGNFAGGELYTIGRFGGNLHRLTRNDYADLEPVWSPDGSKIAWVRYPQETCNCGPGDVWIMNADGTGRHNLTNDRADISGPTWSPDGSRLAFTWAYGIYVIDADGTDEHRISPAGSFDFDPAWSPDGQRIAFASAGAPDYSIDMYAMDPDGTDRVQLSHTSGLIEEDPAWSPDGSRIAFSGLRPGKGWNVFVMPAGGPGHHIVVDAFSLYPAWYPDGSKLVFYACDADCGLYRIRTGGGGFRPWGTQRGVSGVEPDVRAVIPG
jgi:TolB protein